MGRHIRDKILTVKPIHSDQHAYRASRSTETALSKAVNLNTIATIWRIGIWYSKEMRKWLASYSRCKGQGYDNGANMSGKYRGYKHISRRETISLFTYRVQAIAWIWQGFIPLQSTQKWVIFSKSLRTSSSFFSLYNSVDYPNEDAKSLIERGLGHTMVIEGQCHKIVEYSN